MGKIKKTGSSAKKGGQSKKELSPFELLKKAFKNGNTMEAIRLCETERFTPDQLKEVVNLAYNKQNYTFLRSFQDHFKNKEGFTLSEDVCQIILNNREERDYECYDRLKRLFRTTNTKSEDIKKVKNFYYKYLFRPDDELEFFDELMENTRVKDAAKFKFLEDLCLYMRDYGMDPVVYASLMARKDEKYLDWAEKNGIKIDWYIYSGGNNMSYFRGSNKSSSEYIKYGVPTYSLGDKYDAKSVFVPFREGNLQLAKLAIEYMSYYDLKEAVKEAINNKQFEFLKDLSFHLDENRYEKASRFIATELVKCDVDVYGKWAYENEISIDWNSASSGVYAYRSRGNSHNPTEKLWNAYEAMMWPGGGSETNTPDLKVFISGMNLCNLNDADWTDILRYVSHKPEQIDTFLKPLCQYLIETNQISECRKMFKTASEKGFTECAVALSSALTCAEVVSYNGSSKIIDGSITTNGYGYVNGTAEGGRSAAIELARLLRYQLEEREKYPEGFDKDYPNFKKETLEKMACLLNNEIDLNLVDSSNKNALDYFLANDVSFQEDVWFDCVNLILEQDSFEIPTDKTPYLINAIKLLPASRDVVIKLVRSVPELIVQKDENGQDSIMLAAKKGDASLLRYLFSQAKKADIKVNIAPNERVSMILNAASHLTTGFTCLQVLYASGFGNNQEDLLASSFDINQKDSLGYTALHRAIQKKDAIALENLLRFGADDQIETPMGKTVDELIAAAGFTEGAEVLKKARAARGRVMIVDENDLLKFVSYATPEQFVEFQKNRFSGITNEKVFEAVNKAKRADLLPFVSPDLNVGEHGSDASRKTLLEQVAALNADSLDGVFVFADDVTETAGIQGVTRADYELFCQLIYSIEQADLDTFNVLIEKIPPELLLRYNSQGVNPIALANEQFKLYSSLKERKDNESRVYYGYIPMHEAYVIQPELSKLEKDLLKDPNFDKRLETIQIMHKQLIQKAEVSQKGSRGIHFLSSPYLPTDQRSGDIILKKALKKKDVNTVCSLIMDKKFLPSYEDRYDTVKLLIQNKKHKELDALLELARGEGMLASFINPFREGLSIPQGVWGYEHSDYHLDTANVLRKYIEIVYENHDFNTSYEGAARFHTGGQYVNTSRSEEIYFLTIAKRVFPPKESGFLCYNRANVVRCFKRSRFMEKHPEALELFLKLAKDHGCYDEVLGYINPGDKNNPKIAAAIEAANAYVPVVDRFSAAVLRKNVEVLERVVLNELDVPPAEDRKRIAASLEREDMKSVMYFYNQPSTDFAIKTETILPKKEDRYAVLTLLIEHKKYDAVKELLTRAKEAGVLKDFLYLQSPKSNNSLTPIEQVLKSGDQKMKEVLLSVVADAQLDFLEDQKPYEQIIRDAILRKDEETITSVIEKQKYLPAAYQRFDTMKILIEKRNINTVESLLDLMKKSGEDLKTFLNSADKDGVTLLMLAVASNDIELVDLLLKNGADLSLKDKKGNTVFEYATTKTMREHLNQSINHEQSVATASVLGHSAHDITQEPSLGMDNVFKKNSGGERLS